MNRRAFVTGLGAVLAAPLAVDGQGHNIYKVGTITTGRIDLGSEVWRALRERLNELGYVERQTVTFEHRGADGQLDRLQELVEDLIAAHVDIIVAWSTPAVAAAKRATTTVPIVMASAGDADVTGLVASLSRPGSNVTGVSWHHAELATKWIQLLLEVRPHARQILVFWDPANAPDVVARPSREATARQINVRLDFADVRGSSTYESISRLAAGRRVDGIIVIPSARAFFYRTQLAEAALKNRLPSVYGFREYADAGGLLAYAPSPSGMARQVANYVDRILKGAKPADLPVERPTTFELVINLKTAKALGLTIPPSLLLRADQVIE